ncbi:MAG: hypothetical protein LBD53_08015 [Tannerella sp.]|nr:hypothetical protein [Tannerella sp.]
MRRQKAEGTTSLRGTKQSRKQEIRWIASYLAMTNALCVNDLVMTNALYVMASGLHAL